MGSLVFLRGHVLENDTQGLRLSTLDIKCSVHCTVLTLMRVAVTRLLPIYRPNHSHTIVKGHVGKLVCWIKWVHCSFVEELLLIVHKVDIFDVHARV